MLYLLFQMALYMLVTLLLGIWLGWLLWRKGYITKIQEVMGLHPDVVADVPANAAELEADYKRLRDQNAKLASDLANANSQRNTLQNDLDECRASKSKAASVAPAAAAAAVAAPAAARVAAKPAPKAASKAAAAPVSSGGGTKPAGLSGPRGGKADDLKTIKGIGPAMEKMLNGMGYYHFDQIANWRSSDLAWVDDNLEGFKGRASRDNWVPQAKTLAK